ncbi:MAG: FAD-dependent oxidoreductase [Desulfosalsimonadaceae bacterium]
MNRIERTDVVIIGGGLAGMTAALAALSQGAQVCIVDRTALGFGTNSALSNGVFSGPTARYSVDAFLTDTHRIGKSIGQRWMAARVAEDIETRISWLRNIGLRITEMKDHYFVESGENNSFPGAHLSRHVASYVGQQSGIKVHQGTHIARIEVSNGKAVGVSGFDHRGRPIVIQAGAVVLASGGAGALYRRNDNQKSALGQGYALALEAGLALWDMEFVQYYPLVMAQDRLPSMMLNPPHPPGSRIVNAAGQDLCVKYDIADLNDTVRNRRDWFSAVLFKEAKHGEVLMDYRAVAPHFWEQHPLVGFKNRRFDFRLHPVAISPAAHFMMGGVRIDECGATDIKGLFACGEVCWGLHGACRKGGNALSECLVFGHLAGFYAALHGLDSCHNSWPVVSKDRYGESGGGKSNLSARDLRRSVQDVAWRCAGVVRAAEGLTGGLAELERLEPEIQYLSYAGPQDFRARCDLLSMVQVLTVILTASLARQESRGCFLREDYPEQDDAAWAKNSRVTVTAESSQPILDHMWADRNSAAAARENDHKNRE